MDATQDILFGKWHELKGRVRQRDRDQGAKT